MDGGDESRSVAAGTVYIKGESVSHGQTDLAKATDYLRGLEDALSFYANRIDPDNASKRRRIAVRISPGSLITEVIELAVTNPYISVPLTAYTTTAAVKIAKNDVSDKTSGDIAKASINAMRSVIEIAKHMGSLMKTKTLRSDQARAIDINNIVLTNSQGEEMTVTKKDLEHYRATSPSQFQKFISLVDKNSSMYINDGPFEPDTSNESGTVISYANRRIFDKSDNADKEAVLFPELEHGETYELEGELTKGNDRTNTLGFSYGNRILKAYPIGSNGVKGLKDMLFGYVRIKATVERISTQKGSYAPLKKPTLRVVEITNIDEEDETNQTTFL